MATGTAGLFRSEKSAAVLVGAIIGAATLLEARGGVALLLAPFSFLLGPAVARRSVFHLRLAVTHFLVVFLAFAAWGGVRFSSLFEGMPQLWRCSWHPFIQHYFPPFELPCLMEFGILMLWLNAALVQVKCGQRPGLRFEPPLGAAVGAVFAGTVTALALFVMSGLPLMGRFSNFMLTDPEEVLCLVIYAMIFPLTPLVTLSVHDALIRVLRDDPSSPPTVATETTELFRSEKSAVILVGAAAGTLAVFDMMTASHGLSHYHIRPFVFQMAFFLGPVLAHRSMRCLCLAVALYFATSFLPLLLPPTFINGLEELPLNVWGGLWQIKNVPCHDDIPLTWQYRVAANFTVGMIWLNLGFLFVRGLPGTGPTFGRRALAVALAVGAGAVVALALFRMSWAAKVSGTFCRPLYTTPELALSLVTYFLIFPLTPLVTLSVHDALTRVLRDDPSSLPTANADAGKRPQ